VTVLKLITIGSDVDTGIVKELVKKGTADAWYEGT
jgi:hypothetical protein